ncbi:hypothetical protein RSAG8_05458, partial [Rhizoctonia solani AG-8 WAC10335]
MWENVARGRGLATSSSMINNLNMAGLQLQHGLQSESHHTSPKARSFETPHPSPKPFPLQRMPHLHIRKEYQREPARLLELASIDQRSCHRLDQAPNVMVVILRPDTVTQQTHSGLKCLRPIRLGGDVGGGEPDQDRLSGLGW